MLLSNLQAIPNGDALRRWKFQSGQGTQMAQPDVYHNTQFISSQKSISYNIHFQLELQQYTYHQNVSNLSSNCKDENYKNSK